jgi:hypothetical protein
VRLEQSLTASDLKRAKETIQRHLHKDEVDLSLSSLVEDWEAIVHLVSIGKEWTLTTYNKGLRTRDLIEEINEGLSIEGRRILQHAIGPIDKDFLTATYDPMKHDCGYTPETEVGWWQFRIPRDPRGILEFGIPELGLGIEPPFESCGELPF